MGGFCLVKSHRAAADPLTLFQFFTIILFWTFTTLQNSTFGTISRKSISNLKSASAMHFCMFLLIRFFLEKIQLEKLPIFFSQRSMFYEIRSETLSLLLLHAMTFNEENYRDQSAENDHFNLHFCQQFNKVWPPSQHQTWILSRREKKRFH